MPPIGRGLVTLDELRLTMFRLEGRLARIEDFLEALGLARVAAPAPAPAPPAFRPEPVGAAADDGGAAMVRAVGAGVRGTFVGPVIDATPPPPAPPVPRPATRPARSRPWMDEQRRITYRPYYDLGRTAAVAGIGIEACPLCGDRGVAGARRLAWQDGWRSVMSAP